MPKGGTFKFTSKKQSEKGIMSTVLGMISMVAFFVANAGAFNEKGEVAPRYGGVGVLSLIFALAGLVLGIMSFREPDVFRLFVWMGAVISTVALFLWIFIVLVGTGQI